MKILIIEDEIGIASFLQQGLEEEHYKVTTCYNGKDGLTIALENSFDLILLDWMLPDLSGIEFCRLYREKLKTPIIFLTAKDTLEDVLEGLQAGANDYIKKPFHFSELLERIKVQLRNTAILKENSTYTLGPITIDVKNFTVIKNNSEINLTKKEFDLLLFLIKNKNKVCERTTIIQQIWDIHFEYNTGVIDVYINSLRKKLNLSETQNYIQTIRGVGYIAKEL